MRRLLLASAVFAMPIAAHGAVTDIFCGPSSGAGCETGAEQMIFLQAATDVTVGFGNVGSQNGLPVVQLSSDGGAFNMFINLANGFATIKPTQPAVTFNGLDITVPGFTFTGLVFDDQLTPAANPDFTITGFSGAHVSDGSDTIFEAADTDKEYSITAVGGAFDEVNILAATGFDEIKHLEILGLAPVPTGAPEPSGIAMVGVGLLGLGLIKRRRNTL